MSRAQIHSFISIQSTSLRIYECAVLLHYAIHKSFTIVGVMIENS